MPNLGECFHFGTKKVEYVLPQLFTLGWKVKEQTILLTHFFEDETKSKMLSKIKPILLPIVPQQLDWQNLNYFWRKLNLFLEHCFFSPDIFLHFSYHYCSAHEMFHNFFSWKYGCATSEMIWTHCEGGRVDKYVRAKYCKTTAFGVNWIFDLWRRISVFSRLASFVKFFTIVSKQCWFRIWTSYTFYFKRFF